MEERADGSLGLPGGRTVLVDDLPFPEAGDEQIRLLVEDLVHGLAEARKEGADEHEAAHRTQRRDDRDDDAAQRVPDGDDVTGHALE